MGLRVQAGGLDRQSMAAAMRRAKASVPFLLISGAKGGNAGTVNGLWKLMDDKKGGVVYRKDGMDYYIYYTMTGKWFVGNRGSKDAKEDSGLAHIEAMNADLLPLDAKRWQVYDGNNWQYQSLRVCWDLSGCFGLGTDGEALVRYNKMAY